jgi:cell division protein FtsB
MPSVRKKQIEQSRNIKRLVIMTVVILLFIYITLSLVFSEKGFLRYMKLRSDRGQIMAENERVIKQNREIKEQVEELKKNPDAMEEIAREQGLTREGELIFKFDDQ